MLELDGIRKTFGTTVAVKDVSLAIPNGQMVGIIGRSGAGKSTLLRAINRLGEPSAGRIVFDGHDVTALKGRDLRSWRARCAMIFQQFNLVPRLDVLTNVLLGRLNAHGTIPALLHRFTDRERAAAIRALNRLDMVHTAFQRAGTLSGGQQQRVAIARALMQEPNVLLADEPIASLDPRNAKIVMDALERINKDDGITVICNLHTLDTARRYCQRVVGMDAGAVVFDGAPADLTDEAARRIYGVEGMKEAFEGDLTSTSLPETHEHPAADSPHRPGTDYKLPQAS